MTDYKNKTIQAISKELNRICFDDTWYDIADNVLKYLTNFKAKDQVSVGFDEKEKVVFLKLSKEKPKKEDKVEPKTYNPRKVLLQIGREDNDNLSFSTNSLTPLESRALVTEMKAIVRVFESEFDLELIDNEGEN